MKATIPILVACVVGVGCQAPPAPRATPETRGGGSVFVYLEAFPKEAKRLEIALESLSAVGEDGRLIPLDLELQTLDAESTARERLLGFGSVPAGRYVGLSLGTRTASIEGEAGPTALSMPEGPTRIEVPFTSTRRRATVVSVQFGYTASVSRGYRFAPEFTARIPDQAASGLIAAASCRGSDTVTLFNKHTGSVVAVIRTGREPSGMALAQFRGKAYVAVTGDDSVEVIDLEERATIDKLRLQGGDAPQELVLTPDRSMLISANTGSDSVSFIDPDSLFELDRVSVGNGPRSILVDPTGLRAWVVNGLGDSITIVSVRDRAIVGTIATESGPLRAAFSPDGDRLYVIHRQSPNMLVIDPVSLTTLDRVYVRSGASALAVDARTGWIYVAHRGEPSVDVFEPDSFLPIGNVEAPGEVRHLAIDGDTGNLFMVLRRARSVRIVTSAGQRAETEVDIGVDPYWVTMMGER